MGPMADELSGSQAFGLKNLDAIVGPRALPWAEGSQAFGLKKPDRPNLQTRV